jgi:hypothetical protein
MKLLPRYATACNLKIRAQHLLEQFYPLPFTRYITLHAASGMAAKNYSYYAQVVELIKPYLGARGIEIVQIGAKDDPAIPGCYHTIGKTGLHQAAHVIRNSLCHVGNDSIWCHRAGHLGIPVVELFGPTTVANHSPYDYDPAKTIFLESHRWGRQATFASQEAPQSINVIDPFNVARAVLTLLGIPNDVTQTTINIGPVFTQGILELIPNCCPDPNFQAQLPLVVRYDLLPDENVLAQVLSTGRKVNLIAKTQINPNLLAQFRGNFASLSYEVNMDTPVDYVVVLKKIVPGATFFTRETDAARIADIRFKFFDIVTVQQHVDKTRGDFENAAREYSNDKSFSLDKMLQSGDTRFKSNKLVLSNGKVYPSLAHQEKDIPIGAAGHDLVMDDVAWWRDMNHFMVYR